VFAENEALHLEEEGSEDDTLLYFEAEEEELNNI